MHERPLRILQVNTHNSRGGAARVASQLFHAYRKLGHKSWLLTSKLENNDKDQFQLNNNAYRSIWTRACILSGKLALKFAGDVISRDSIVTFFYWQLGQPARYLSRKKGYEDFNYPATWRLLDYPPEPVDLLHLHNLHGDYFDLRALSWLSKQIPVVITLHDAWMLSGHCAHSFGCERWRTGCGSCPDLTIYPAIEQDNTRYNWERKRKIYSDSRFFVVSPSRWLLDKAQASILSSGMVGAELINNGIDTKVFHPGNKSEARAKLHLPSDAFIFLFASEGIRTTQWRDYETMRYAVAQVANLGKKGKKIIFLALGESSSPEQIGNAVIQFIPFENDLGQVALYHQASDAYLHASRSDNFPSSILEAMACGTPVIATSVGGIPEQIENGKTGLLVQAGDKETFSKQASAIFLDDKMRLSMGANAASIVRAKYNVDHQVDRYLSLYRELLSAHQGLNR